jgi:hypothetical protein
VQVGSLIVGLAVGVVVGVGGTYGIESYLDSRSSGFDQDSLERGVQRALGNERARIVRCHQSDGPFWVCRALTAPGTGKLYNVTIAPNGRCYTGVEVATAMEVDDSLAPAVRGWRSLRADCMGTPLPGGDAMSSDAFADTSAEASATAFPAPPADSSQDSSECDPNYAGACLDPESYDFDCEGGSGDGPDYTGTVEVVGTDVYGLDRDGNGTGCD